MVGQRSNLLLTEESDGEPRVGVPGALHPLARPVLLDDCPLAVLPPPETEHRFVFPDVQEDLGLGLSGPVIVAGCRHPVESSELLAEAFRQLTVSTQGKRNNSRKPSEPSARIFSYVSFNRSIQSPPL
jgi:hypothetical protein